MTWSTIDSAPRDATKFWGRVGDDAISMLWHEGFQAFVSSWRRMTLARGSVFEESGLPYKDHSPEVHCPTHWQPLPEPPE